jgi:hypothetical protein
MPTLTSDVSLSGLADILCAAEALGPRAWSDGSRPGSNPMTSPQPNEPTLTGDLRELFLLLRQRNVDYLLVGGVALLKYIDGRNTRDIDLLLSVQSLDLVPEIVVTDRNRDFAHGSFKSVPVDFLFTDNPLFKLVRERYATSHRFAEVDVPCATVEGLVLLKLYALPTLYRQGDGQRIGLYENDIFMLCERYRPAVEPLLELLRPFLDAGALRELGNIVADIQARIARVDQARGRP